MIVVGIMSGTSMDGVDVSIVDITGKGHRLKTRLLGQYARTYSASLRKRLLHVSESGTVAEVCHMHALLGEVFSATVLQALKAHHVPLKRVRLIGSHGQTVYHRPHPIQERGLGKIRSTLQIGDPAILAERTGVTTVSDFRARDMAVGGEGAPLAPYAHALIFHRARVSRLVVNLGGIANVTVVPGNGALSQVRAFDIGPCNMLLDGLITLQSQGRRRMDPGGRFAKKGQVDAKLLTWLLAHPYLDRRPPKSTGREMFGAPYVRQVWLRGQRRKLSIADMLATSCRFIAEVMSRAQKWIPEDLQEVIVGGGGVRNAQLWQEMEERFSPISVKTMDACGSHATAFEAQAFAVLAYQALQGVCANLPSVTGARHPVVLGSITPGPRGFLKS